MSRMLFVGAGKGAWHVRGIQMAEALGATATCRPTQAQLDAAQVIVLVKHAVGEWAEAAQRTKAVVVWDALDCWAQPAENRRSIASLVEHIRTVQTRFGIRTVIGATQAMASALGGIYLPHHSRPGLSLTPARDRAQVVAYEGNRKYLGAWRMVCEVACARLGLEFVVNPKSLAEADVVVALRDGPWDGDLCRQWKSGVKYVNALSVGRPVITQASSAFDEIGPYGSVIERFDQFEPALAGLLGADLRRHVVSICQPLAKSFTLPRIAQVYRQILEQAVRQAA